MKGLTSGEQEILKRLNLLISLQLEQSEDKTSKTVSGKILKLSEMGTSPADIAHILAKPSKYIWTNLLRSKSRKKSK